METKKRRKRIAALACATGAMSTVLIAGAMAPASASTIPNGHIQACAQGDYPAFIHILPAPIPNSGGMTTETGQSPILSPGSPCWWAPFNTWGQWVQVDVVGIHSSGQEFYIRSYWWNSSSGLGIGAEGDQWSPWTQTW